MKATRARATPQWGAIAPSNRPYLRRTTLSALVAMSLLSSASIMAAAGNTAAAPSQSYNPEQEKTMRLKHWRTQETPPSSTSAPNQVQGLPSPLPTTTAVIGDPLSLTGTQTPHPSPEHLMRLAAEKRAQIGQRREPAPPRSKSTLPTPPTQTTPLINPTASGAAPDSFKVADIRLDGLLDIEAATVLTYLPIKVGDTVNPELLQTAIQNLYGTRLFDSVTLRRETSPVGQVLVVELKERAIIGELVIEGAYEFEADKLKESLRGAGLSEGKLLDPVLITLAEQEIKRQYISRGYYAVAVNAQRHAMDNRRIKITLSVSEGKIALIDRINIYGNKAFSVSDLREQMDSTDSSFFKSGRQYSRQKLDADLDRLRAYYLNQGYLDFRIDSTQVSISPDLTKISIAIGVTEGPAYTVRAVELANPSEHLSENDFQQLNTLKVGALYSQDKVNEVSRAVYNHLAQQGFAQARADTQKIKSTSADDQSVLLRFEVQSGQRMSVRNINISGNTRTSDEVIRREFRLTEGELFDSTLLDKSRQKIERLDFFSEVNVGVQPTSDSNDQVDVSAKVVEKRTGNLQFGLTSSNVDKVGFNASVQQNNWLGTGKSVSISFNTAKTNRSLNANYFDPYITHWGLGLGLNAFDTNDDSSDLSTGRYIVRSQGAGARLVYPLDDDSAVGVGIRAGRDRYTIYSDSPDTYIEFTNQFGLNPTDIVWNANYTTDKRDSAIYPMKGLYFRASHERTLSSSDLQYARSFLSFQFYTPLSERMALFFNTDVAQVQSLKGNPIPFSKYLFVGGIGSVRGFEYGTLGPYDSKNARYTGGDRSFNANLEWLLPFPGSQRSREARIALFADTGMAWGPGESRSTRKLRSSYGLALSWTSPIGPLRFSYAKPVKREEGDRLEAFQFQVGTSF